MRTVVRTHEPPLARPRELLRSICVDLRRAPPLALELAQRDLSSLYRDPVLGAASVLLAPLAITAVALGFRRAGILTVESASVPYGVFVLAGVILWMTLIDALYAPIQGLAAEQRLLARTTAPPEAIVAGKLGPVFVTAGLRLLLLAAAIAWYGAVPSATILLALIPAAGLMALGSALGLVLAPLSLLYQDVSKILGTLTTFWFFLSPVYFPAPPDGTIGAIVGLNPVTPLLSGARAFALAGASTDAVRSVYAAIGAVLLLAPCWLYLRIALPIVIEQTNE
jgi:lipopolysaccharide transport system permease protein